MLIRFDRTWRGYKKGQTVDFVDGLAGVLCSRGVASRTVDPSPVDPPPPDADERKAQLEFETAVMKPATIEKAVKRKGRE